MAPQKAGEATPVRRSTRAAAGIGKSPRTTRRAAASAPVTDYEGEEEQPQPAPRTTTRRRATAARQPKPPAAKSDFEEEEQPQPTPRRAGRRRSATATRRAKEPTTDVETEAETEAEDKPPAAARSGTRRRSGAISQDPSPAPASKREPIGGFGTPVFWLLLLLASASAFACVAYPYCQEHDCEELLHNLPELASEAAADAYGQLRGQVLSTADAVREQWHIALEMLRPVSDASEVDGDFGADEFTEPLLCQFDAGSALHAIMPIGEEYVPLRTAAAAVLSSEGLEPQGKAAVSLLVCEAGSDCLSIQDHVNAAVAHPQHCVLHLDGPQLGEGVEALQAQLADFLQNMPTGIVLVQRIDQLSPVLLPVLVDATQESGILPGSYGGQVSTTGATFLLTSVIPREIFGHLNVEAKFNLEVKSHMVVNFTLRAAEKLQEEASAQAKALRRRIDYVIPVGSDPLGALAEVAGAEGGQASCRLHAKELVEALLPEGEAWAALRESTEAVLGAQRPNEDGEPGTVLFVCDGEEGCEAAVTEAGYATGGDRGCMVMLEGPDLSGIQELQYMLAAFLTASPSGIVMLNRLDKTAPDLLAVLVDALSRDGAVQADGGDTPVPTSGATFILTSHMPKSVFAHVDDEARFRQDVHFHMVEDFRSKAGNTHEAGILAEALLQRLHGVVPVGSHPDEYDAWMAAQLEAEQALQGEANQEGEEVVDEGQLEGWGEDEAVEGEWEEQAEFYLEEEEGVEEAPWEEEGEVVVVPEEDGQQQDWVAEGIVGEELATAADAAAPELATDQQEQQQEDLARWEEAATMPEAAAEEAASVPEVAAEEATGWEGAATVSEVAAEEAAGWEEAAAVPEEAAWEAEEQAPEEPAGEDAHDAAEGVEWVAGAEETAADAGGEEWAAEPVEEAPSAVEGSGGEEEVVEELAQPEEQPAVLPTEGQADDGSWEQQQEQQDGGLVEGLAAEAEPAGQEA